MKVKLLVNSFPKASETFLFNLVVGLEERGVEVTVCATSAYNDLDVYKDRISSWSGKYELLPLQLGSIIDFFKITYSIIERPTLLLNAIRKFGIKDGISSFLKATYLLKGKPDIIHFAFSGIGISFLKAISLIQGNSFKYVVSCRGTAEKVKPLLDEKRKIELGVLFGQMSLIHCVSYDMKHSLEKMGLPIHNSFINYPSINVSKFKKLISNQPDEERKHWSIVTTGSLNFAKGYIFALQAMKLLKERGYKFTYRILGEGPDRPMITYSIHDLGLVDEVKLFGKVSSSEVLEQLNQADVFLLPSIYEGVANAALEAMAMEIPLITTDAGGMAEVVEDQVNGMLVRRFDGPSIANAVEIVMKNPELRKTLKENGRATVEGRFSTDLQIDIFNREYKAILETKDNR